MKKNYWNYACLIAGLVLLVISIETAPDGMFGYMMVMSSVILIALGFMIGNNPGRVLLEFLKNLFG